MEQASTISSRQKKTTLRFVGFESHFGDRVEGGKWQVGEAGEIQAEAKGHSEASGTPRISFNSKSKKLLSQRGLKPVQVHTASQDPT